MDHIAVLSPPLVRPAAASVLTPDWLGRTGEATVLAALPRAVYLHAGDWPDVLCVLDADALRLPNSVVVPSVGIGTGRPLSTGLIPGDVIAVGAGRIELPSAHLEVRRTFRPASIGVGAASGVDRAAVRALLAQVRPGLPGLAEAAADVLAALGRLPADRAPGSGDDAAGEQVARTEELVTRTGALVGRGPGLTPSGDDVLAGVLLGLRAAGRVHAAHALAAAVAVHLRATTSLSASLLRAAGSGWCLPEVCELLDGLRSADSVPGGAGGSRSGAGSTAVDTTVAHSLRLLDRIGHSSGHDLAIGLLTALSPVSARSPVGAPLPVDARLPVDSGPPVTAPAPAASTPARSALHRERTLHA